MKPWLRTVCVVGLCVVCLGSVAHGHVTLEAYKKIKGTEEAKLFVWGVGEGFTLMNTHLRLFRGQRPVFCVPESLSLRAENYIEILDREIARSGMRTPSTIEIALLDGLIHTFPCQ